MTEKTVTLDDAEVIIPDMRGAAREFEVTLHGDRMLGAPLNPRDGKHLVLKVRQDETGHRKLSYDPVFAFHASRSRPEPVLHTGGTDVLTFGYAARVGQWHLVDHTAGE